MAIHKEFEHQGYTLLYRVTPTRKGKKTPGEESGRLWAELRVLREPEKLGEITYAQQQLLSYEGPGQEKVIDQMFREQAERHYGVKIPR